MRRWVWEIRRVFKSAPDDFAFYTFLLVGNSQNHTRDLKFSLSLLPDPVQGFILILEKIALNYFTLYDIFKVLMRERRDDCVAVSLGARLWTWTETWVSALKSELRREYIAVGMVIKLYWDSGHASTLLSFWTTDIRRYVFTFYLWKPPATNCGDNQECCSSVFTSCHRYDTVPEMMLLDNGKLMPFKDEI